MKNSIAALTLETSLRQQLEREIRNLRSDLARARAELADTRAGERDARHLALHDSLTSLPNRRYFEQRLAELLASPPGQSPTVPPTLAVLYLDLDGFKPVNDSHGHDAGDQVLRIIGARLARAVRAEDTMSRLGGDEFACLAADNLSRRQLGQLATKLFDTVSAPLRLGGLTLFMRPSIGIATCPNDGTTVQALLRSADAAMYRAKHNQTGHAFCDRGAGPLPVRQSVAKKASPALTRHH